MAKAKIFQIRSKRDAQLLAQRIRRNQKDFYYHVPLVGGMEGSFVTIRCEPKAGVCEVFSSIPGSRNEESKCIPELAEHLWNDRKYVNAELRRRESEWYGQFTAR